MAITHRFGKRIPLPSTRREDHLRVRPSHWPAAGFVDTEIGCFMKPEVADAETEVQSRVQGRGGSARS